MHLISWTHPRGSETSTASQFWCTFQVGLEEIEALAKRCICYMNLCVFAEYAD
jgi:hypothetical protein